jgi:UDP-N-acetylglucosamine transferase subunit ALG13
VSTFIALGNARQPFTRLLQFIESHIELFPAPVIVQRGHTPWSSGRMHCVEFVGMEEFEQLIQAADVVIMQAGGGAVLQAVAAGKIPIVVPRRGTLGEHVDDHQVENGLALAASGRVVFAEHPESIPAALQLVRSKQSQVEKFTESPLVA